ncbi:nickel ABC transporter ATP-binding protein NikE [Tahibacter soli]|uniref:ABC transporter ATP-binding protein n=1 Tax=Tahibacter soli TaxID=2983605 RepID=A0A9X4BLH7_9GAMM|nr:ABC transporter ATP-binding protein [Tahibacter soli]MDC8014264.1 ABC transporter ATP-binding protein [Tahibacter soli]
MSEPLLDVRGLSIALPGREDPVVANVDLSLAPGECLALVGASGSGKSLTAAALVGLAPRGARVTGAIRYAGRDYANADAQGLARLRGGIGMVWQDSLASLHPLRRIGAQIVENARLQRGLTRAQATTLAADLLAEVGVDAPRKRLRAYPHALSGGQRQRVAIALALAGAPRVLVADEATSALDATVQAQVVALLDRLRREHGLALLFVTHDLALARAIADRIAVMERGAIVEAAPSARVFEAPASAAARALVECRASPPIDRRVPGAALLRVDGLSASFAAGRWRPARPALAGVGFALRAGETLALVGESGSGKSTLARCLLGLKRADAGVLRFGDATIDLAQAGDWSAVRQRLQLVFQDPYASLDPHLTVQAIVAEPLVIHGRAASVRDAAPRVAELLDAVGLDAALAARYPHALSGGQRQRVAIARALALDPACLVLDEATSALDVLVQKKILDVLRTLQVARDVALLMITHDLDLAAGFAERIGVLWRGELVEIGASGDVFARPRHAHTRALVSARLPRR